MGYTITILARSWGTQLSISMAKQPTNCFLSVSVEPKDLDMTLNNYIGEGWLLAEIFQERQKDHIKYRILFSKNVAGYLYPSKN